MKKILISLVLVIFLFSLVACGGNKLIASKKTENDGFEVKQNIEVIFNGDNVKEVNYIYKFKNNEKAQFYYSLGANDSNYFLENVVIKGSKMTGKLKDISEYTGKNKDEIKSMLEEKGFKVK